MVGFSLFMAVCLYCCFVCFPVWLLMSYVMHILQAPSFITFHPLPSSLEIDFRVWTFIFTWHFFYLTLLSKATYKWVTVRATVDQREAIKNKCFSAQHSAPWSSWHKCHKAAATWSNKYVHSNFFEKERGEKTKYSALSEEAGLQEILKDRKGFCWPVLVRKRNWIEISYLAVTRLICRHHSFANCAEQ